MIIKLTFWTIHFTQSNVLVVGGGGGTTTGTIHNTPCHENELSAIDFF
jgi:spermidine synthase